MPENPHFETSKICLLDYLNRLPGILNDEVLSKALIEYDESNALARIDELINLYEAPVTGLLLNDKAVILPVCLAEICFSPLGILLKQPKKFVNFSTESNFSVIELANGKRH